MRAVIQTEKAPRPVGPYSQAIAHGQVIYCSGQIGIDPSNGMLVGNGAAEQARQALRNLEAVLISAGCSMADVVKTTIFVTDMADFKEVNESYARSFAHDPPARSTVAVSALPLGARVEIEVVAHRR